jgi:dephospho-CoA kinase
MLKPMANLSTIMDIASPLSRRLPRVIGLTGGLGMGKTTVANYLHTAHQLSILDADLYARQAVEPESAVLAQIVERYGDRILLPSGGLDRERLGDLVFNNASERHWVEQQIHPFVRQQMETDLQNLAEQNYQTAVLVVPLLFEARMTDLVTEIWVVHSADQQQVERLQQRDQLSLEQIHARISSQMAIAKKLAQADVVLDNSSSLEVLYAQVDRALKAE